MIRRLLALVAATLILALAAAPAVGAPGQDPPEGQPASNTPVTPDPEQAIEDLVGCVSNSNHLLVLFLIDESFSLQKYDPDNRRVDAAASALESLTGLATAGQDAPKIDVLMAAFSNKYRLVKNWTPVRASTRRSLGDAVEGFRKRNRGIDTDFVNALTSAQKALTQRAAAITEDGSRAPCRAVLLFTDGQFDLAVRNDDNKRQLGEFKPYAPKISLTTKANVLKAEEAGRSALCKEGGLADELRADEVTLLTVALSGDLSAKAQRPLAAATAGKADDYPCGRPVLRTPGAYLPARDESVLIQRFDEVAQRLLGGTPFPFEPPAPCEGEDCAAQGAKEFDLDRNARNIHIFGLGTEAGTRVKVEAPGGEATISKAGAQQIGPLDADVRSLGDGLGFSVDIDRPDDDKAWTGSWTVTLVDEDDKPVEGGAIEVYVFSDLQVEIALPSALQRGSATPLRVDIKAPEGVDIAEMVAESTVTMRVDNRVTGDSDTVELTGGAAGPFVGNYEVPDDLLANAVDLTATLKAKSKTGAELVSQTTRDRVFVRRIKGSIQFAPPELEFPSVTSKGSTSGNLLLLGGKDSGCVWFGKPELTAPDGATPITFTVDGEELPGKGDCIVVKAGEQKSVEVKAKPAGKAIGSVAGTLTVFEKVGGQKASETQIALRFDIAGGIDTTRRLVAAALMIFAGIAGPMILLLIINTVTARFQDLDAIVGTALPITVQGRQISRREGGRRKPFQVSSSDFKEIAQSDSTRRFTFGGIDFRTRASRNPFGGTQALAAPEGGAEKLKGGEGSRVELDPSLAGSWIFLLDADETGAARDGRVEGTLIAFAAAGGIDTQVSRMVPDIENRLPATAQSLATLVRATPRKAPKPPRTPLVDQLTGPVHQAEEPDDVEATEATEVPVTETAEDAAPSSSPFAAPASATEVAASDGAAEEADSEDAAPPPVGFGGTTAPPAGFGGTAAPATPAAPADGEDDDTEPPPAPAGFGGVTG